MYASTGFTPAARTRTTTSPGPALGSGASSGFMTAGPPNSCTRIAFIVLFPCSSDGALQKADVGRPFQGRQARLKASPYTFCNAPILGQACRRRPYVIIGASMQSVKLHRTVGVKVGHVQVGGGAPIVVQSMTMTDTADARSTAQQCIELAGAGSEMVRVTVNVPEAAAAVPEIKQRMLDAGCEAPLIGDFHYNGHLLLTKYPDCARALDKYRINPGNVGTGTRRDEQFSTICQVAVDHAKPGRIGGKGGSPNHGVLPAE